MQTYQQLDAEIVATPAAIEAASQPAATDYQKIKAEFAASEAGVAVTATRVAAGFKSLFSDNFTQFDTQIAQFDAEVARIEQMKEQVRKQRENSVQQEQEIAIPQILAWMKALDITPEQLGFAPQPKKSKAPWIPRYRDPVSGKKHSGKGGLPSWLTPETKNDPRYENPEWTAKKAAADAAKAAKKSKNESEVASVVTAPPASKNAATVSNDAPTMSDGVKHPASNDSAPIVVTNVGVADATRIESNFAPAPFVSNLN